MHVGIDLGTTYSLIARVDAHGAPVLFPDMHEAERFKTPSVVSIGPDGALVGQPVEELLDDLPELPVARFVKLKMGTVDPVLIDHLKRAWMPESISALILKKLCRDARVHNEEPLETAVIGVPAHFSDLQRKATLGAAALAGLAGASLAEEPLAAATYYGASKAKAGTNLLVYDLGGGTFDATALHVASDGLQALATEGVSDLGGKNFDETIMSLIAGQFRAAHQFDPSTQPAAAMQLRRHAESIKIKLSLPGKGQVRASLILGGRMHDVVLTREQFDRLTGHLIERSIAVCESTLAAAGLTWQTLDQVILVGGSTLLPAVESALGRASALPSDRFKRHQPHMAIAYGAALLAAAKGGAASGNAPPLVRRIAGFDLGFRVLDPQSRKMTVDVVIAKNSPIPARKSAVYFTNRAEQNRLVFEVVQARNQEEAPISLGHFAFMLDRPRKNHPLEVTLGYDENGLVTVVARNPDTGAEVAREFVDAAHVPSSAKHLAGQLAMLEQTRLCE